MRATATPSEAASVRAAATATTRVRTAVALPSKWKVRTKGQVKVVRPEGVTRCTKSGWQRRKVAGRRAYVAMTLTCRVPADGVAHTVTLVNGRRRSQRLGVPMVVATPTTTALPPATPTTPEPAPAAEQAPTAPTPRAQVDAADFAFMATQPSNNARPVTWDRCQPIDVAVNLGPAPADEQALVAEAIHQVAVASGLPLQYAGATVHVPGGASASGPAMSRSSSRCRAPASRRC